MVGADGKSGNLASMAPGLPYTIAAQIAYPERQCVGFVSDGGFSMLMAEFATCVKYKLPVKIVIVKNDTLGQIKWEALALQGPVLIEAAVDPYEPPLPANITADQAVKFAESLARGELNRKKIALTVLADKVKEMV